MTMIGHPPNCIPETLTGMAARICKIRVGTDTWLGRVGKQALLCTAAASALALSPQLVHAQTAGAAVVFLPPPADAPGAETRADAISGDGTTVVGTDRSRNSSEVIWRNGVPERIAGLTGDFLNALNFDGSIVVGGTDSTDIDTRRGFIWTRAGGRQFLANVDPLQFVVAADDISTDGRFVAVTALQVPAEAITTSGGAECDLGLQCILRVYRWSQAGGYESIGQIGTRPNSPGYWGMQASAISGDGSAITGIFGNARSPVNEGVYLWRAGSGLTLLPFLSDAPLGGTVMRNARSSDISRDGSVVVGSSVGANGRGQAVVWRNGIIAGLGFLPGTSEADFGGRTDLFSGSFANAVNADGTIIVGTQATVVDLVTSPSQRVAWRWTAATGMQDLNQIVRDAGLTLNGFVLDEAVGISDSGAIIVGNATNIRQNQYLGFVLQLAQITRSQLIVQMRLAGVTLTSTVNQTFNTEVMATLNGQSVFTRNFADRIDTAAGTAAFNDARAALAVSGLRRVTIGAPILISNTTTVTGTTSNTVDVLSGTQVTTATVNAAGPTSVITGDRGICATPAAGNVNPTGCSLAGTSVAVPVGILNSNIFTNTLQSITPTTSQTVNQLISAKWQVAAVGGNQFGTVHALVGPATFERGDQFVGQLTGKKGRRTLVSLDDVQASLFGGYSGGQSKIDADATIPVAATKGSHDAFTIGGERRINQHLALGAAFDHGTSDIKVQDPQYGESLELKQTQVGVFGKLSSGRASLSGALSYGFGDVETTLATPTGTARASRDAKSWTLGVEGAYDVPLGSSATLALIGGARTTNVDLQAFTETGGSSPLRGLGSTVDRTRIYAGFDLRGQFKAGSAQIEPSLYARTAQDSGDKNGVAEVVFASTPSGPTLQALGPNVGKTVTEYGAALSAQISTNTRLTLGYDATTRDNATSSSARLGLSVAW